MTSPFYLFPLPQLVYSIIINSMTMTQQILISMCSSKANSIVKSVRREKRSISLIVQDNEFVTVVVHDPYEQLLIGQVPELAADWPMNKRLTINGKSKRFDYSEEKCVLGTIWDDVEVGTMEIIKYFDALFGAKVELLEMFDYSGCQIMKWLQRHQDHLLQVAFYSRKDTIFEVEALNEIIRDCEAHHIGVCADTGGKPFKIQNSHGKCVMFRCTIDTVFTVENIMQIEAPQIYLTNRWYENEEIHQFIGHWMNGGNPYLKALRLPCEHFNEQVATSGIPVQWNPERRYYQSDQRDFCFSMDGGFEVQRDDGTKALFNISIDEFFSFVVEKALDFVDDESLE
uniref:FBA_2 domain-containing protein n=1 Tax=Caenorhabditis tropicalis TaxID=1561998 RepID=A0A1I7UTD9_9PELO